MRASTINLHPQTFSERLQAILEEKRITQAALAEKIYLSPSTISRWFKSGSAPQPRTVEAVANAIGVRKEWLLTGEGERNPDPSSYREISRGQPAESRVAEPDQDYQDLKRVIYIQKEGTEEQREALTAFLDALCKTPGMPHPEGAKK